MMGARAEIHRPRPILAVEAAAGPAPSTTSSAAAEITALFEALDRNLAAMPTDGDRAVYVNLQLETWESRELEMLRWAQRNPRAGRNPFAPWTAFDVAIVRARLGAMHAALADRIKASATAAMAALPEDCR